MRDAMRTALGLILVGMLGASCNGGEDPKPPIQPPEVVGEAASTEPAEPEPASEELRITEPDPEALGVEGTLPDDVPTPAGAKVLHPPMVASGATRASFEVGEPIATVRDFYKTRLAESGWSLDAEKELDAQVLMSAKKGERELSVAMSETAGRTQLVLLLVGQ